MSDTPDPTTGGATPGEPGKGPAPDPWDEARRLADEARERAREARDQARTAREQARDAARNARRANRDYMRQAWGTPGGVIGIRVGSHTSAPVTSRILLGVAFMAAGVLWTLDNFGILDSSRVTAWWPLLIVLFGAMKLSGAGAHRNAFWGGFWMVVGSLMVMDNLGMLHFSVGQLWPLALVALGALFLRRGSTAGPVLLAGRIGRRGRVLAGPPLGGREGVYVAQGNVDLGDDVAEQFEIFSVWSQVDRKVNSQSFRKAEVGVVMGGIRLDLRGAKTAPGGAVIDLSVVAGSLEVVLPPGWQVANEATVLMGAITDSTVPGTTASGDRLILRGAVVMAGVELKSA